FLRAARSGAAAHRVEQRQSACQRREGLPPQGPPLRATSRLARPGTQGGRQGADGSAPAVSQRANHVTFFLHEIRAFADSEPRATPLTLCASPASPADVARSKPGATPMRSHLKRLALVVLVGAFFAPAKAAASCGDYVMVGSGHENRG